MYDHTLFHAGKSSDQTCGQTQHGLASKQASTVLPHTQNLGWQENYIKNTNKYKHEQ